jgi:hypothetical protein
MEEEDEKEKRKKRLNLSIQINTYLCILNWKWERWEGNKEEWEEERDLVAFSLLTGEVVFPNGVIKFN